MFAQAGFKRQSIEYRFLAALRESNVKEAQFWKWASISRPHEPSVQ